MFVYVSVFSSVALLFRLLAANFSDKIVLEILASHEEDTAVKQQGRTKSFAREGNQVGPVNPFYIRMTVNAVNQTQSVTLPSAWGMIFYELH